MGLATGRASLRQTNQPSGNPRLAQSPRLELLRVDPRALEGWAHRTSPTERSHRGGRDDRLQFIPAIPPDHAPSRSARLPRRRRVSLIHRNGYRHGVLGRRWRHDDRQRHRRRRLSSNARKRRGGTTDDSSSSPSGRPIQRPASQHAGPDRRHRRAGVVPSRSEPQYGGRSRWLGLRPPAPDGARGRFRLLAHRILWASDLLAPWRGIRARFRLGCASYQRRAGCQSTSIGLACIRSSRNDMLRRPRTRPGEPAYASGGRLLVQQ